MDRTQHLNQRLAELEERHLGRNNSDLMGAPLMASAHDWSARPPLLHSSGRGSLRPVTVGGNGVGPGAASSPYTGDMLTTRDRLPQPIYRGGILFDGEFGKDERLAVGKQVGYRPEATWRVSRPLEMQRRSSGMNPHQLARNGRFATERVRSRCHL